MADRYTKIVLTVIAVALSIIAIQQVTSVAQSQSGMCGSASKPCHTTSQCYDFGWKTCDAVVRSSIP